MPSGWRIEITNDTSRPLVDIAIPVSVKYGEVGNEHMAVYQLVSVRLDPGPANRRVVYLYNQSPEGGVVQFLSPASVSQVGSKVRGVIPIHSPSDWVNRVILLMPSFQPEN